MKKANALRGSLLLTNRVYIVHVLSFQCNLLHQEISNSHVHADRERRFSPRLQTKQRLTHGEGHIAKLVLFDWGASPLKLPHTIAVRNCV